MYRFSYTVIRREKYPAAYHRDPLKEKKVCQAYVFANTEKEAKKKIKAATESVPQGWELVFIDCSIEEMSPPAETKPN